MEQLEIMHTAAAGPGLITAGMENAAQVQMQPFKM